MQWIVHGERILYDSAWVRLALVLRDQLFRGQLSLRH